MDAHQGRCLCGAVTYSFTGDPAATLLCHCRDCQRQSGAPASIVMVVPSASFQMQGQSLAVWQTTGAENGLARERWFCNRCGSPIVVRAEEHEDVTVIKAGTLDDVSQLRPGGEMWTSSAQPWWEPVADAGMRFERGLPAA